MTGRAVDSVLCYMFVRGFLVFGVSGQQFAHASVYFV